MVLYQFGSFSKGTLCSVVPLRSGTVDFADQYVYHIYFRIWTSVLPIVLNCGTVFEKEQGINFLKWSFMDFLPPYKRNIKDEMIKAVRN